MDLSFPLSLKLRTTHTFLLSSCTSHILQHTLKIMDCSLLSVPRCNLSSTQNMNTFKVISFTSLSWNLALSVSSSQLHSETYTVFSEKIEPKLELNSSCFCYCYPFVIFADQLISSFLPFDFILKRLIYCLYILHLSLIFCYPVIIHNSVFLNVAFFDDLFLFALPLLSFIFSFLLSFLVQVHLSFFWCPFFFHWNYLQPIIYLFFGELPSS